MEKLEILPAQPEDAEELTEISMLAKSYWQYPDEWLNCWREELTITPAYIKQHRVFTIQSIYQIAGFCALEKYADYYQVGHLWLRVPFMMKGLGTQLLQSTLSVVSPGTEVRVVADPNAESFYEKQGFTTYGQVESYPPGRFLPLMKKQA